MIKKSYRFITGLPITFPALFILIFFINSCYNEEDSSSKLPQLTFQPDSGYVCKDTTIAAGAKIKVKIHISAADGNITYFNIRQDNGTVRTVLDSGMNSEGFNYELTIIKGFSKTEKWTFLAMDKFRNKASISLTLYKDTLASYGKIKTIPLIRLGANNSPLFGSFYSFALDSK